MLTNISKESGDAALITRTCENHFLWSAT